MTHHSSFRNWSTVYLVLLLLLVLTASGCFPTKAGPKLAHFTAEAPKPGDEAPDFVLTDLSGKEVRLADLHGTKPVVLQFGSHSCPVYRYRRHSMRDVVEDYQDRVHFLMVYTVEAHPVGSKSPYADGEWDPLINRLVGVRVDQAENLTERKEEAQRSHENLRLSRQMVVDTMNNSVWNSYGAASSPAFVIDTSGFVVLTQPWVEPKGIKDALDALLRGETPATQ